MASVSKASSSTGKGTHKKSGTSKSRKHTKSTSSDNQEELKRDNDAPKGHYAVFKSDTIECFAEQYLNAEDMKLSSEFCSQLAEDTTYKVYELIQNLKTYAHPTGGTVTTDIVNDVIRSVAVPPVFGAPKPIYQKIKITKDEPPNYFVQDSIIDILNEIEKEINIEQSSQLGLKVDYFLMQKDTALIQTFYTKICRGLLSGSEKSLRDCLHILRTLEQFEPILPNLLTLCALVLKNYLHTLTNEKYQIEINNANQVMYQRVLLMLVALSNNRLIRTASVYNELYHIVQELCQILFLYADINSVNKQMTDSTYKMNEHLKNNEDIKTNTNIEFMESDFQTDISIIDENNSSMVMNMDDIIECKNIFFKKTMNKSNVSLYDIDIIEQLCNVLTTIGKNWLCVRGKIIEILLSNLYFNMNDPKSLQCTKLIAMAVSKLLYGFDVKAYIELDNWLIEIYGEGVLFEKPIQKTYLYMHV